MDVLQPVFTWTGAVIWIGTPAIFGIRALRNFIGRGKGTTRWSRFWWVRVRGRHLEQDEMDGRWYALLRGNPEILRTMHQSFTPRKFWRQQMYFIFGLPHKEERP